MLLVVGSSAQPFSKKRIIIFAPRYSTDQFFLREKEQIYYCVHDSGALISDRISRIRYDSIYIDSNGYRLKDINRIGFPLQSKPDPLNTPFSGFTMNRPGNAMGYTRIYSKDDSASWHIFILPDSVYDSKMSKDNYLRRIKRFQKEEKTDKFRDPIVFGNFLKLNIMKLFHVEIALAYERKIAKRATIEFEAGYMFGFQDAEAHYTINYPLYNYTGYTFLIYPKFYCFNNWSYISPAFQYRYLWFDGVRTDYPGSHTEGGYLQDQVRNDYGLSLRFGIMKRFGHFIIDWYAGAGLKIAQIDQVIYGWYEYHDSNNFIPYDTPKTGTYAKLQPIINFGIKMGAGF